jgi:hypothetical protein
MDGMDPTDAMDDPQRAVLLGEIASEAALERNTFLIDATTQLKRFLENHSDRIRDLGGMVLIDEEPDYLSIAPDGTFRSRSRYLDDATGQWEAETEVIDSVSELVELYNPAEIYAAFADAARELAGFADEPTAADDLMDTAGISPEETVPPEGRGGRPDPYAEAAADWAASRTEEETPENEEDAARRLYDLALTFQERSQSSEARLIEGFEVAAAPLSELLGDFMVVDDEDERLTLARDGSFSAEVVPEEGDGTWRRLTSPTELVEFYDPTDVFGDLAEALAEAYPGVAPEEGEEVGDTAEAGDVDEADEVDEAGEDGKTPPPA